MIATLLQHRLNLTSSIPDLTKCIAEGPGLNRALKSERVSFSILFQDVFGNAPSLSPAFQAEFRAGMAITNAGAKQPNSKSTHEFVGEWTPGDGKAVGSKRYTMSFVPNNAGAYSLHVWVDSHDAERTYVLGSPFELSVHANASDQVRASHARQTAQ